MLQQNTKTDCQGCGVFPVTTNVIEFPSKPNSELRWWGIWRSIDQNDPDLSFEDIANRLDTIGTYRLEKLGNYTGMRRREQPTLGAWLKIYLGLVAHETYILQIAENGKWITVSGQKCVCVSIHNAPQPIEDVHLNAKHISQIYRVSETNARTFGNGYHEGYERGYECGRSDAWAAAKSAARKAVWKEGFDADLQRMSQRDQRMQNFKDRIFHYNIYAACALTGALLIFI